MEHQMLENFNNGSVKILANEMFKCPNSKRIMKSIMRHK